MSNWRKLPISERYNTWKLYREAYPEMSHRDMIKHFDDGGTIGWPPVRRKWDEDSQEFVDVPYAPEKEPSILKATKVDPYIVDKFGNYKDPHKIRMFTSIDDANIGIRKNIRQGTVNQSNIWPMKDYQEFENIELDTQNSNKVFWP